jgi:hypothetical protein
MADPAITVALVAAVPGVLGGIAAGWSILTRGKQENLSLTVTAMQQHMVTLAGDNATLRSEIGEVRDRERANAISLAQCESDKAIVSDRLDHTEAANQMLILKVAELERRMEE